MAVHALLGTGRALRNVANRRFHILGCQRLLLRSLSFEAFAVLPMPARGVSLPEVQAARLLQAELYGLGATFSGDIRAHWPNPRSACVRLGDRASPARASRP